MARQMMTAPLRAARPMVVLVTLAVAVAVVRGAGTDSATLRTIGSTLDARIGTVAIEASDPVPYVASQPAPGTFVVELRGTSSQGFTDHFKADPRHPVTSVVVESATGSDGAPVARVRLTLSQPQRPRVRSARNVIYVEAERADAEPASAVGRINLAGPATVIRDVRVATRGAATAVTFEATARLSPMNIRVAPNSVGVVLDLPNVTSAVPNVTKIAQGPVQQVRVGLNPRVPLMTQVTVDLLRASPYHVESSSDGNSLTLLFDPPSPAMAGTLATDVGPVLSASAEASADRRSLGAGWSDRPLVSPPSPVPQPSTVGPVVLERQPTLRQQAPPAQAAPAEPPAQPPAQIPAPLLPASAPPSQGAARFTGHAVTLDFQGADLRAVLRSFSEISGLNIVLDPTLQGSVDVALRDVPWDQALDIILRANKLGYSLEGTIVRIAPLTVLADEEAQRQKLAEAQAEAGELRVLTRSLSYAKAVDLVQLIKDTSLSRRGNVQIDPRTNTVIVTDLADRLTRVESLLTTLDRPEPQVEIEARIVQTSRDFARNIGIQWGMNGRASQALGNSLPLAFPNQGSVTGRTGVTQGAPPPDPGTDAVSNIVNLGVTAATSGVGLALGSINGALNLDVALSALESSGQGRILSTPRVSTQNNIEAEIMQGIQIPVQTVANNTVTVTFRDASLILRVTPQITAANTVIMRIMVENSSPDFSRAVNNIPPIDTQRATTQVLVSTGETTVIGGIYTSREQTSQDRTPGLHRLPLLGWLFKRNEFSDESRELLIFITPKIVRL